MNASRSHPPLNVGQALREGWEAFSRAPWLFVAFALLVTALHVALQFLQPPFSAEKLPPLSPDVLANDMEALLIWLRFGTISIGLLVFTSLVSAVINLWGICGMLRAAWVALGGRRPDVATFIRWDPAALVRLYVPSFLLGAGVAAVVAVLVLLAVVVGQVHGLLTLLPGLLLLAVATYLSVSQAFLPQVALFHDNQPLDALARGHQVVDPVWPRVVWLLTLNFGLFVAGLLACGVGLFVAWPVIFCVSTAAYRQLFGPDDRTGVTSGLSEAPL